VATSGILQELTALEQARARLETALGSDENWRALHQSAGSDAASQSAAQRARDTRLKMALAENPLYQAWRHLGEAISALHESGARGESAGGELPEDVAALLRDPGKETVSQGAFGSLARRLQVGRPRSAGGPDGRRGVEPKTAEPQTAARSPAAGPPPLPPAMGPHGADVRGDGSQFHQHDAAGAVLDEATVTFVRRDPLLPSAELPADLGTGRASELFERLRALTDQVEPADAPFRPPGSAEEAEVVIVTAESAQARQEAEARASTIRRLRKALSGD
jgi:hypothetical protein